MRRSSVARLMVAVITTLGVLAVPALTAAQPTPKSPPVTLLVSFDPGTPPATQDRAADASGEVVREVDQLRLRVVEVPAARAAVERRRLRNRPEVAFVETDTVMVADHTPNDIGAQSNAATNVKLPEAWDVTRGSSSVTIAVIDTGLTPTSPELPASKVVAGRNIIANNTNTTDDNGHGTAAASVAAMVGDNGAGSAGACWLCTVMPVKVLNSSGSGTSSAVAAGIVWAADHGADVINLSLSGGATTSLKNAVDYAESKGIPVVASAGNNSSTALSYPAGYSSVISVAANNLSGTRASYSNYGTWVKLSAPGTNVALNRTGSLVSFAGTSSSAPVVAGAVGLLRAVNGALTPAQIRSALTSTADPVSFTIGSGKLDAGGAVAAVGGTPAPPPPPSDDTDPPPPPAPVSTTVTGGGFTSTGVITRTLTARAGAVTFEARCSWCSAMTLQILDSNNNVIATLAGDTRFTLSHTLPSDGTYFFRVTTNRWGYVSYAVTYFQ